jgi:hypothetical protein
MTVGPEGLNETPEPGLRLPSGYSTVAHRRV